MEKEKEKSLQDRLREMGIYTLHIFEEHGYGLEEQDNTVYHCKSGLVLKLKPVSSVLIRARAKTVPYPKPPMYYNPTTERDEENWGSPEFVDALTKWDVEQAELTMGTLFLYGTHVLHLPEDIPDYQDHSWSDSLEDKEVWGEHAMTGIPPKGDARYIRWLEFIALRDEEAMEIGAQIRILGGAVPEEAVQEAMDSFRGNNRGTTDNRVVPVSTNRKQRRSNKASNRG